LLDLHDIHQELAKLAEAILQEVLEWAINAALPGRGAALDAPGRAAARDLCVVGMGKLGGAELNYNSDLDLLFLFSGDGGARLGEPGRIRQEHFARVAQKLLFGLSCVTSCGYLYHIDARLRPSGRQGSLVSSLDAFARYHETSAQLWERLALVRARPVAGSGTMCDAARAVIERACYGRPLPKDGVPEIARLRARMEVENAREDASRYDVKLGKGGIADVEFATQLLQLEAGHEDPSVRAQSTERALEALERAGVWAAADLAALRSGYAFLRRLESRLRIVHDNAQSVLERDGRVLEALARRMAISGGGAALERAYLETSAANRDIYTRVVEALR
jgi:glutamate-ammonia-ligase adenylyltransferase